jgi:hypothetical protein
MPTMNRTVKKTLTGSLAFALGLVGLAVGTGSAQAAEGPFTWCPGQSMDQPSGPNRYGTMYGWDMNQCHTWYRVAPGFGNVLRVDPGGPQTLAGSSVWDGDNPPPDLNINCGLFYCPNPPQEVPGYHGS